VFSSWVSLFLSGDRWEYKLLVNCLFCGFVNFFITRITMWPGDHNMEIIAMEADEHVSRRSCMRVTRRCDDG